MLTIIQSVKNEFHAKISYTDRGAIGTRYPKYLAFKAHFEYSSVKRRSAFDAARWRHLRSRSE